MDNEQQFKQSREAQSIKIRKQNREGIFLKKRKVHQQSVMESQNSFHSTTQIVLDQKLRLLIESCNAIEVNASQIEKLCQGLNDQSYEIRHQAAIGLRKLLSSQEVQPYLQTIVDKGAIYKLIDLIRGRKYPQLQFEACWIITNICYSSSAHCNSIVQQKGIEAIMQLLYQNSGAVIDQALWGLGNIAGDCISCRNKVIMGGGVQCMIRIIQNFNTPQTIQLGCWVLSNLCRGQPIPNYEFVKKAIPVLCRKVVEGVLSEAYLISVLWSLCLHSQGSKSKIRTIISLQNIVAKIVQLCYLQNHQIVIPSLRILGNISTGNTTQTDCLLNNQILKLLAKLLMHKKRSIRRQACWILSNIAAGPAHQVHQVIQHPDLVANLAEKLLFDEYDVRREICFIFSNFCHLGQLSEVFRVIEEYHMLEILAHLLQIEEDHKILEASLRCLYDFLAIGAKINPQNVVLKNLERMPSVLDRFQSLQLHTSHQVYKQVSKICQRFFSLEEGTLF